MYMKTNVRKQVLRRTGIFSLAVSAFCLDTGASMANPGIGLEARATKMAVSSHFNEVDVIITGTVVDASGQPIPGVTVSVPGTTIGTATDLDGRYSINVPEGSTLVISFIGF